MKPEIIHLGPNCLVTTHTGLVYLVVNSGPEEGTLKQIHPLEQIEVVNGRAYDVSQAGLYTIEEINEQVEQARIEDDKQKENEINLFEIKGFKECFDNFRNLIQESSKDIFKDSEVRWSLAVQNRNLYLKVITAYEGKYNLIVFILPTLIGILIYRHISVELEPIVLSEIDCLLLDYSAVLVQDLYFNLNLLNSLMLESGVSRYL